MRHLKPTSTSILVMLIVLLVFSCKSETKSKDTPESTSVQVEAKDPERHIALEGESNFRDLGGYKTVDGRTVKWRQVFRTGELSGLSDKDVETLDALGIKTVVNFLLPEEIEQDGEDRLPEDVNTILDPITGERSAELSMTAHEAINSGNFEILPADVNLQIHAILMDEAKEQYARLIRRLINPELRPMVFHCSGGIHRTGTATAILLSALGVPWDTIKEDYLYTNVVNESENEKVLAMIRKRAAELNSIDEDAVDMTNIEAFFILDPAYIEGALKAAEQEYGSMDAYIRQGLGITDEEIEALKATLLE